MSHCDQLLESNEIIQTENVFDRDIAKLCDHYSCIYLFFLKHRRTVPQNSTIYMFAFQKAFSNLILDYSTLLLSMVVFVL